MNRTILITGATGVLGSLVAKTFGERGHNLVLFGRETSHLDSLAQDLNLPPERILTQTVDLINGQAVQDSAKVVHSKFGNVHALIHLVGGWLGGKTFAETSHEEVDSMFNQHMRTTFNLFHSFSPSLAASGWGRVIIVSASTVANPPAKRGVYLAAKAAQENMVLSLAAELKDSGVTANIIQVRAVDVENKGTGATPQEIVSAMSYLFSEEANKINGARIPLY